MIMLGKRSTSPRGIIKCCYDDVGGVGLGIVAALGKSDDDDNNNNNDNKKKPLCYRNLNRSRPIPVTTPVNNSSRLNDKEEEEYTVVTRRGQGRVEYCDVVRRGEKEKTSERKSSVSIVHDDIHGYGYFGAYPTLDFLSSCHLCHKKLHGKDIYMYRGERAFCSPECRYRQIVMDERKDKCGSEASTPLDLSTSPYTTTDHIFFSPGILAT